ncbi:hypothetical protein [Actinomadura sp. NEAU-AAG7]|uniref:hypothetical protein n=1 Tax=Actinomadura sp. NEAU-AAG7 TaxID=2839640 RepID=UPI001BE3F0B3|nr:hypothetical protein [Actinomadura sp. NEAU-AAG7]MBT2208311.1 hypothetical protein [Actinomadura sp. NEAU-AAG7]
MQVLLVMAELLIWTLILLFLFALGYAAGAAAGLGEPTCVRIGVFAVGGSLIMITAIILRNSWRARRSEEPPPENDPPDMDHYWSRD